MSYRIVAALALSLGLSTAALAQTTDTTTGGAAGGATGGSVMLPSGWEGPIGEAFFSDSTTGALRSEEEIRSNWGSLSAEQQAQVRSDCETHTAAAGTGTDENLQTGSTTDNTAATGTGSEGETAAGATGDLMASMTQLCDVIEGM